MSSVTRHTAPVVNKANGIDICYDTFGDRLSPAMLLISGHGCPLVDWDDDLCAQLADRGFWVIRYDNRDVGHSSSFENHATSGADPSVASYTLVDMADDGAGLLDQLGIKRAHVVGLSMGGFIA